MECWEVPSIISFSMVEDLDVGDREDQDECGILKSSLMMIIFGVWVGITGNSFSLDLVFQLGHQVVLRLASVEGRASPSTTPLE